MQRIAGDDAENILKPVWNTLIQRERQQTEAADARAEAAEQAEAQARARAEAAEQAAAQARARAEAAEQRAARAEAAEAEARRQSLTATLLGLVEQRFPPLSAEARARILDAAAPDLNQWLGRIRDQPRCSHRPGDAGTRRTNAEPLTATKGRRRSGAAVPGAASQPAASGVTRSWRNRVPSRPQAASRLKDALAGLTLCQGRRSVRSAAP